MTSVPRWQSQSHAAVPLDALPSEYKFASSPPVPDTLRSWNTMAASQNRNLSSEERMAETIRRKFSGDTPLPRADPQRKTPPTDDRATRLYRPEPSERPAMTHVDRKLSNEERYLKSSMDERVARALNERKASNEERGSKADHKAPPRLELSRLFSRRKSSKNSNTTSTPSSAISEHPQSPPLPATSGHPTGAHTSVFRGLRKSRSRDSPVEQTAPTYEQSYKINVRKPPPGIQHWFDGLSEEYAVSTKGHSRQSSAELPQPNKNRARDTFLSNSTDKTPLDAQKFRHVPARKPLHGVGIPRSPISPTLPSPSDAREVLRRTKTSPDFRPDSQQSSSSVKTAQPGDNPGSSPRILAPKRHCLPESIQESVLVLSETDDSDTDESEPLEEARRAQDRHDTSIRQATVADVVMATGPVTVRRALSSPLDKPLQPVRVSGTIIEDESQIHVVDDGYSARTSLLSDLRPLSFRSRASISTAQETEDWDEDEEEDDEEEPPSPTTSMNLPERAMRHYFDPTPGGDGRPDSQRRWETEAGPTHKLMAVTPEEAALLSAMRKKRAYMQAVGDGTLRSRPSTAPEHARSKSHVAVVRQRRAEQKPISVQTAFSAEDALDSPDGISPRQIVPPRQSRQAASTRRRRSNTSDTVSRLWEDVQQWRRAHGSFAPKADPDESQGQMFHSRFSMDTDTAGSSARRPAMVHTTSDDRELRRSKTSSGDSANRSKSMGRLSGGSGKTDAEQEVLAAWNELGGRRRSGFPGGLRS